MLSPIRATSPLNGVVPLGGFRSTAASLLAERRGEPEWLREQRSIAASIYCELPLPRWERGIRGWWTTDPSELRLDRLSALASPQAPTQAARHSASGRSGMIVLRDGVAVGEYLDAQLAEQGVVFADLGRAVREREDLVRAHLGGLLKPGEDKFVALHNALWTSGVLVYVPASVEVSLPLQARYELATPEGAVFGRTLLIAAAGSRVTYVEDYASPNWPAKQGLHSGIVEIYAQQGADVRFVTIHNWGDSVFNFALKRAVVHRDAQMHWVVGFMGSALTKAVVESRLCETGASVDTSGLFFGSGKQHLDLTSRTFHEAPHTQGDVLFKGIVRDEARSALEGLIRVEKAAQQTTSYLSDHTLQLSRQAKSNAIPSLEIEANDVRVSHGATVGMIDEEQLFYLMTRGLDRATAEQTIVGGFFEPVLARIPVGEARRSLSECIERKMRGSGK